MAKHVAVGDILSKHDASGNAYEETVTQIENVMLSSLIVTFNAEPYDLFYADGILTHNK
jgi:hypothetical protein